MPHEPWSYLWLHVFSILISNWDNSVSIFNCRWVWDLICYQEEEGAFWCATVPWVFWQDSPSKHPATEGCYPTASASISGLKAAVSAKDPPKKWSFPSKAQLQQSRGWKWHQSDKSSWRSSEQWHCVPGFRGWGTVTLLMISHDRSFYFLVLIYS